MMKFFISVLISFSSYASFKVHRKDDLTKYRTEVLQIGAKLKTLQNEIEEKNHLYQTSLEEIRSFENEISDYKNQLKTKQDQVLKTEEDQKKIIKNFILESSHNVSHVVQRKIHLSLIKQNLFKLQEQKVELEGFVLKVSEFDSKLADLKKQEQDLASVLEKLEEKKNQTSELYQKKLEKKVLTQNSIDQKKLEKKSTEIQKKLSTAPVILNKAERQFSQPLFQFMTKTPSSKGVTFKYDTIQPVKAAGGGKVVFAGDLASYGQVIMIDHGDDLRTVILGKMDIKIRKDDSVSTGDIIAYTQLVDQQAQNLYFEVRKKNTAQNTILWLASDGTGKI